MQLDPAQSQMVVYALATIFVIIFIVLLRSKSVLILKYFESQGSKREGQVTNTNNRPKLTFAIEGLNVVVSVFNTGGGVRGAPPPQAYINIETNFQNENDCQFRIFKEGLIEKAEKIFGSQDIQIGRSEFDSEFMIQGNNRDFIQRFLMPDIQDKILHFKDHNPGMRFNKKEFLLRVPYIIKNEENLDRIIELGIILIKRIKEIIG